MVKKKKKSLTSIERISYSRVYEDGLLRKKGKSVSYAERAEALDSGYTGYLIPSNPSIHDGKRRIINSNG